MVWLAAILSVIAYSELGVALVNRLATRLVRPSPLPRLDFSKGIPDDARTLVVVPTMLGNVQAAQILVEALEVRYLANRDRNLQFALLTDFLDADQAELPADSAIWMRRSSEIEALNARYSETWQGCLLPAASAAPVESRTSANGWATSASAESWPH